MGGEELCAINGRNIVVFFPSDSYVATVYVCVRGGGVGWGEGRRWQQVKCPFLFLKFTLTF